jgi:uncharacterized membrane protein YccC
MLSYSTKNAIKVALSFTLTIALSLYFGWEKPYWAAVTIIAMAANETYSHSIKLARDRLLGTMFGAILALLMISFLSQERFLFISVYIVIAGIATYMAFNLKYGYIFRMAFVVCSLISAIGSFNDITSFDMISLRLEENVLGVIVYSLVFRFIWPNSTEQYFFDLFNKVLANLEHTYAKLTATMTQEELTKITSDLENTIQQVAKMKSIIDLPMNGSYQLKYQQNKWKTATIASYDIAISLKQIITARSEVNCQNTDSQNELTMLKQQIAPLKDANRNDQNLTGILTKNSWKDLDKLTPKVPKKSRLIDAAVVMVMIATFFFLWIYIPLLGGYLFPLLAAIFSVTIMTMPKGLMKSIVFGTITLSAIILAEFVFIMPFFTELWQLGLFYFINIFAIWRIFAAPQYALYKLLGGNFLVILTMSALRLTPTYTIDTSLNLLIQMFLILGIIHFFEKLSSPLH